MNGFIFFTDSILPYISIPVLLIGTIWRLWQWFSVPLPLRIGLSPSPQTQCSFLGRIAGEVLVFKTFFSSDRARWFIIWPFHLVALLTIVHHLLGFSQDLLVKAGAAVNLSAMSVALFILALSAWFLIIFLFYILIYRISRSEVRKMSSFSDYFALFLILGVIIAGTYMTFFSYTTSTANWSDTALRWAQGLVTFHPSPIGSLAFSIHFLLVQILFIYFPFSKLFHPLGQIASTMMTPKEELLNPEGKVVK